IDISLFKLDNEIDRLKKYTSENYYDVKEVKRQQREVFKQMKDLRKLVLTGLPKIKEKNGEVEIIMPKKPNLFFSPIKDVLAIPNIIPTVLFAIVAIIAIVFALEIATKDNGGFTVKTIESIRKKNE